MIACPPACVNRHTGYCLTLFNQLFGKHMFRPPKSAAIPTKHRMRSAMRPNVSSVIFFHSKRNPRKPGWHPVVLVGLPARSPATAFCYFCPLDARSRECEASSPTPQPIGLRASAIRTGSAADSLYRQNLPFPIFSLIFKVRR